MLLKKNFLKALMAAGLALSSLSAHAWDGVVTGKIVRLDGVNQVGNYDLRVYLDNASSMCTGGLDPTWSYINANDANYKGLLSMVLTAYTAGKTITVYANKRENGYCQIGYIAISG